MEQPPLSGVRIVDLTSRLAGPFATRVLAEAGADVVKVERPGGDPERELRVVGFAGWNRAKRSVVIDLDDASGRVGLDELLARADVVVHDLPAARAVELGLDDETLAGRHPDLLVASVPGYPVGHPLADLDATDAMVQAAEGFMDEQQGNRPGPVWIRMPFPSWCAAYALAAGIVARLVQRERDGVVLPVATSLFQGSLAPAALYWQRWERLPETLTRHTLPKIWPDAALSIFECADGRWVQLAGAVGGWIESPPVLEALALADLVDLSEIGVTPGNWSTWNEVFGERPCDWWLESLSAADVPCIEIRHLGECFTDQQAGVNGYVVEVDDPVVGPALQAATPVQTTPASAVGAPAPLLGSTRCADVLAGWSQREPRPGRTAAGDTRPLAGLRALDFGSAIAGPFGAQCLGDLGAEVVKVEPLSGDRGRVLTQFAGAHRGKRSLAMDLKSVEGQAALDRLVASADLVLHNMRLGPAGRLGLDGPGLRRRNPTVVFSHVSAYGPLGPMAGFPGYDPTAQAMTGWEHANAGEGQTPIWLRNSVFDVTAGLAACLGAVLGLYTLATTGRPGAADTSLLSVGIAAASEVAVRRPAGGVTETPGLDAEQTGVGPAHRIHQLQDGWLAVDARDEREAAAYASWLVGTSLEGRRVEPTVAELAALGVAAAPVRLDQLDDFMDSPVHRELGFSRRLQTGGYGAIDLVAGFWSLGQSVPEQSVPELGEHSREILDELGYSDEEVSGLVAAGSVHALSRALRTST
ncbi:CoA transferase [Nocardioides mangrovicus]|nr:CoA transferase [Nocardioides mangrovicus]